MHMTTRAAAGEYKPAKFFIDSSLLDPYYDYDFTDIKDGDEKFERGRKRYYRPCGWQRYALKVKGNPKYGDDKWLGQEGHRLESTDGEWPVSYHGTQKECSDSITRQGFLLSFGRRHLHGRGIYSTPSIDVAMKYSSPFDHEGKKYRVVFQNRICPDGMKVIPAKDTLAGGEYWIQENENLIRPYGIYLQPVT